MEHQPPSIPEPPDSPNELHENLRGKILGVTRFGPRAMALVFAVTCVLFGSIVYGLGHGSPGNKPVTIESMNTPPPVAASDAPHFGQNEPIVSSPSPDIEPVASAQVADASTAVPNLQVAVASAAPAVQTGESPAEQAARQREQQLADARAAAERARESELEGAAKSPIIINNADMGNQAGAAVTGSFANNPSSENSPETERSKLRLASDSTLAVNDNPEDFVTSKRVAPKSRYTLVATTVLPSTLITELNSDEGGIVFAQVRENVYDSLTGRYLLVPQGSRLMGKYEAVSRGGQSRIEVVWYRLIFPDTTNIDLQKMLGADVEGGAGLEGITDNHWGDILHAALLSSILAVGIAETTPQQVSIITEPTAGQIVAQTVGHNVSDVGNRIVQRELNRPPTIHIKRGYPFNVVVDRDISFDAPYTPQL